MFFIQRLGRFLSTARFRISYLAKNSSRLIRQTDRQQKVLMEFLESEDKLDRKFAVSELSKAFVKMIPQSVDGGEDENGNPIPLLYGIYRNDSNQEDSKATEEA